MGYCADYILEVFKGKKEVDSSSFIKEIEHFIGYDPFIGYSKWNCREGDMKEISKKHSEMLFVLYEEGQNIDDVRKIYFKDGKMQITKAKIIFEKFNENKLE